jgi:predicted metal-dependent enzyme (double-stranded beta helix superfamily)
VVEVFDVETFIEDCRGALSEAQPVLATKDIVERAVSRPGDLASTFGEPVGGLRAVHQSAELTILHFVWPPNAKLFAHDHRMWAVIGIYGGGEDNEFYRRTPDGIVSSGGTELRAGDTVALGAETIHAVTNPFRSCTTALHIYGGDFFAASRSQWNTETGAEEPYDIEATRRILAGTEWPPGPGSVSG